MGSFQDIQGATEQQKADSRKFTKDLHAFCRNERKREEYMRSHDNLGDHMRSLDNLMSDKVSIG